MKLSLNDYISIFIHQTDLSLTSYVKSQLAPFNLAPEQNLIMMLLWEKDGRNQNEISEILLKDKTNIARMVVNLEKKGFIKRVSSEKDRRSLQLFLTQKGKELGSSIIPITNDFNKLVCKGITEKELNEVQRILSKMCENVQ
ncbi:MarR family winged helix-turn-helix transcriptional regulator [Niallia sp. NCCP-28]|uniref:MarR family winged helix-turn-helix transcriptional regulator n=1 Tax=Niallia sp. NCCP-28 TaxID=2934712 RepID=UPI002085A6D9|nr:MarR family transcriptional regulator [Niallia sp. NCCP-28]GKU82126.1 MarR family transcriptional regulator [Niallia sp. NCCP-28]